MVLGERIRKYRTQLGLSQEQLADIIYVTRQTVSNWESGKSTPDIDSLQMLCALFHVTPSELIFDSDIDSDISHMMAIATHILLRVDANDHMVQALVTMTAGGKTRYRGVLFSYRDSTYEADQNMERVFIDGFDDGAVVKKIVCVWKTKGSGITLDLPSFSFRTKLCEHDERNRDAEIAMWNGNGNINMVKVYWTLSVDAHKNTTDTNRRKVVNRIFEFSNGDIIAAHKYCRNNKVSLQKDKVCGCFYCMRVFSPDEIKDYIRDQIGSAMCPYCGVDSVIGESSGYPITADFLRQMNEYWFEEY